MVEVDTVTLNAINTNDSQINRTFDRQQCSEPDNLCKPQLHEMTYTNNNDQQQLSIVICQFMQGVALSILSRQVSAHLNRRSGCQTADMYDTECDS